MNRTHSFTLIAILLVACDEEIVAPPPPVELTGNEISHYDQMIVVDHEGPKAQILLESRKEPAWFSSVRDAFAFHFLPEEPRDIAAMYVTDMAEAESWTDPGPGTWIEARDAWFVIGSAMRGGMGAEEPVRSETRRSRASSPRNTVVKSWRRFPKVMFSAQPPNRMSTTCTPQIKGIGDEIAAEPPAFSRYHGLARARRACLRSGRARPSRLERYRPSAPARTFASITRTGARPTPS